MPQATALIDGNNFYASCEQSLDPSLIGRPVVVLSTNDGCTGSQRRSLRPRDRHGHALFQGTTGITATERRGAQPNYALCDMANG